jgi:hypothetical protein
MRSIANVSIKNALDKAIKILDSNRKNKIINDVFRELEYIRNSVENSSIKSEVNGAVSRIKEMLNKLR